MTEFEPELCDKEPPMFELTSKGTYIQRKDIHEVEYHSLDGSQTFKGYECYSREISKDELDEIIIRDATILSLLACYISKPSENVKE